ncbi:arylsulfatase [Cyclobacterium jeungdonense]|uniref:Arylsulfatase n=1 Tax=Cyclobacterium jeungdonense TaxID=708087 RepID=A0ABT8C0D4_9BACT|nr:arylsulfatase [Cyclobacterium jeungdonense]MDN3686254.1 arylsulfatase [Cyclobacterium jeungdonense]
MKQKMTYFKVLAACVLSFAGQTEGLGFQKAERPNVILIITDDQGYGDLGIHGNPHVQTPVLDKLGRESVRLTNFYVSPVCAPTRSSLMTGRYSLRTGVRDTYNGGAIMATEEVTLAEMLQSAGYRTGIFGKWHLGDNYPFRPGDQGFEESLIHLSGGMGQPGDFTTYFQGDRSYFDPVLWYNGEQKAFQGYCSDIFTTEALTFMEEKAAEPFFLYLSFNAPHTPLQVPDAYYDRYKDLDPSAGFDEDGRPFPEMSERDKEAARKVYAMVSNIDDNVGRVLNKLEELDIAENTIVIFMTDNGPQQARYVGGMRGRKGSVFRGGVRVPFFLRLPDRLEGNRDIPTSLAHIDVLPTLAEICGASLPTGRQIDGKSFYPLLRGKDAPVFDERSLFFYWTRRYPELYTNVALQKGKYKLVGNTDFDAELGDFDLFDLKEDPYELNSIVEANKPLARALKSEMDAMIADLTQSPQLNRPQRVIIGSEQENPVYLNRNDAGGERGIWTQEEVFGMWKVKTLEGRYRIRFKFIKPLETKGKMVLETNSVIIQEQYEAVPTDEITLENVYLPEMEVDLIPHYVTEGRSIFPLWMELEKISDP